MKNPRKTLKFCLAFKPRSVLDRLCRCDGGAAALEYALLAGLVSAALIGSVAVLGDGVKTRMTDTAQVMAASAPGGKPARGTQPDGGEPERSDAGTGGAGATSGNSGDPSDTGAADYADGDADSRGRSGTSAGRGSRDSAGGARCDRGSARGRGNSCRG